MPATAKKPELEEYVCETVPLINPKKPDFTGKVKIKELVSPKQTQVRDDTDSGYNVDVKRCEQFASAMEAGTKFPPIKYMVVEDMPGHKGEPVKVIWDGFHTHGGCEMLDSQQKKKGETAIDAVGWKGTWAQCLAAAAMFANVEHEASGKPKSYKDKVRAAQLYVNSLKAAEVPKSQWPKSRQLAVMVGVSHTAINDENILENRKEGTKDKEAKLAAKKNGHAGNGVVAAGQLHLGGNPSLKRFEVIRRATGEQVGIFEAENTAGALEQLKKKEPKSQLTDFQARELTTTPKPGSEKVVGFDWHRMDSEIGSLARGLDGLGDIYGCRDRPEYKSAKATLNQFLETLKGLRVEFTAKRSAEKKAAEAEPAKK